MSNHKWNKKDVCVHCGLNRVMRSWKRRMAIVGSKDYFVYGRNWYYGYQKEKDGIMYGFGFLRPDCDKEKIEEFVTTGIEKIKKQIKDAGLSYE